jgi:hypothetical protein
VELQRSKKPVAQRQPGFIGMHAEFLEIVFVPCNHHHWRHAMSLSTSAGISPRLLTLPLFVAGTVFSRVVLDKEAALKICTPVD